jgi:hypothetical protein
MSIEWAVITCIVGCIFGYWLVSLLSGRGHDNPRTVARRKEDNEDNALSIIIKACVYFAHENGLVEPSKKQVVESWIRIKIGKKSGKQSEALEMLLNASYRDALSAAKLYENTELPVLDEISRLKDVGNKVNYIECIELMFDIISVEAAASPKKLSIANNAAFLLNLENHELKAISDRTLVGVSFSLAEEYDLEYALGIDQNMTRVEVIAHLREEFTKWNNRLSTMGEVDERRNIQNRLDLIAKARRKYGG